MEFYHLQPHHIPANAILIMSCVATCLEAYVGIGATKEIFAKYFFLVQMNLHGTKTAVECGAAAVQPRRNSIFPKFVGLRSCKKWQQTYFYVKNRAPREGEHPRDRINLPFPYQSGPPPADNNNWNYNPSTEKDKPEGERDEELITELAAVDKALAELKAEGLEGDDILYALVEKRVSPLQRRSCTLWQMSGRMDQHRMSTFVLSKESIYRRVKAISDQKTLKIDWTYGKEPYSREHPPPSVRFRTISSSFISVLIPLKH
jgi:hypothetical protein